MIAIDIFPWKICCDSVATLRAYKQMEKGYAEICGCDHCLNFLKVRDRVYPATARDLFSRLGIDYKKEAEVAHAYKIKSGWHCYMGWFHFVGTVERLEKNECPHDPRLAELVKVDQIKVDENFSWSFSSGRGWPRHEVFKNQSTVQIDFDARVPWVLDKEEPG